MSIGRRVNRPEKAIVGLAGLTRERQAEEEAERTAMRLEREAQQERRRRELMESDDPFFLEFTIYINENYI
jgi:hypothetical protein